MPQNRTHDMESFGVWILLVENAMGQLVQLSLQFHHFNKGHIEGSEILSSFYC